MGGAVTCYIPWRLLFYHKQAISIMSTASHKDRVLLAVIGDEVRVFGIWRSNHIEELLSVLTSLFGPGFNYWIIACGNRSHKR